MDFSDDSYSFQKMSSSKKKSSINNLQKIMRKFADLNFNLALDHDLKELYQECDKCDIVEAQQVTQILYPIFEGFQIQQQYVKPIEKQQKSKLMSMKKELQILDKAKEKKAVKEQHKGYKIKLLYLIIKNKPLPFILKFIELLYFPENQQIKLKLKFKEVLMDMMNYYLIKIHGTEEELEQELKLMKILKKKELLTMSLNLIQEQKNDHMSEIKQVLEELAQRNSAFLYKLKQYSIMTSQQNEVVKKQLLIINDVIINLSLSQVKIKSKSTVKFTGFVNFQQVLMVLCWMNEICFPEILLYIQRKIEEGKHKSNYIHLAPRMSFLRKIYNDPQIRQQCWVYQIVPIKQSALVPNYLKQENFQNIQIVQNELKRRLQQNNLKSEKIISYEIEAQLKLLIKNFNSISDQIIENFRDVRFQYNRQLLRAPLKKLSSYLENGLGRLSGHNISNIQRETIIINLLNQLESLVQEKQQNHTQSSIIKFNLKTKKKYELLFKIEPKQSPSPYFYIKLFVSDMVSIEQPFTLLFKFIEIDVNAGMVKSKKLMDNLVEFLSYDIVRQRLEIKYNLKIEVEFNGSTHLITKTPLKFDDATDDLNEIPWEFIVLSQLQIIEKYKQFIKKEIIEMFLGYDCQNYRNKLKTTNNLLYVNEQLDIFAKLQQFAIEID